MNHDDAFTQGAQDCRANGMDRSFAFDGHDRDSYRAGWERAFWLACQRPDVAEIMPQHFN
jgi:hypothetical protein